MRHGDTADQIADGALASGFNILRALCGRGWKAIEVCFDHRAPADTGALRRFFQCPLSFEQVTALFSMHARTLARRLQACGTRLQVLVDEIRFEIARQTLEGSAMDIAQVAKALDYADASAFTRAFRHWSGSTPAV